MYKVRMDGMAWIKKRNCKGAVFGNEIHKKKLNSFSPLPHSFFRISFMIDGEWNRYSALERVMLLTLLL
jgi:hypothetical protein